MTTKEEKAIIADTVIEYSDAAKRLVALEVEARKASGVLQKIEFAFRAALSISDKASVLDAIQRMPSPEWVMQIMAEIDEQNGIQAECESTLKRYGVKLPPI